MPGFRYVIVVPRTAPATLAYLMESLKNVADVEVVLDRRRPVTATPIPRLVERRAPARSVGEAFGCALIRIETPRRNLAARA
jgi:hypothetical protein